VYNALVPVNHSVRRYTIRRLGIVAVGLALVVGVVVGGVVGNPFGASAPRTSAAAVTGSGCYTNWNSADCAAGYEAVSAGEWTAIEILDASGPVVGSAFICAAPKSLNVASGGVYADSDTSLQEDGFHRTNHEPCAICCATGPSVVGGIAELPAVAGSNGTSGMGSATYAVLAGAAAGVLAFVVLATLALKRRGVR
jgi:hypothetical protein